MNLRKISLIFALLLIFLLPSVAVASFSVSPLAALVAINSCSVGSGPTGIAFNPSNNYMYVLNANANTVTVLKGTCSVVSTISSPSFGYPSGIAFDPKNGMMYVTNNNNLNIVLVKGTSVASTITNTANSDAAGVVYDPSNGYMFMADFGSSYVTVLNGTTIVKLIPVHAYPAGIAYDTSNGNMYVTNSGGGSVSVIGSSCLCVLKTVKVGSHPDGVSYNPTDDRLYVVVRGLCTPKCANSLVEIFNPGTMKQVGSVTIAPLATLTAYSATSQDVYVVNCKSNTVTLISGLSISKTIHVGGCPADVGYNALNGKTYVTQFDLDKVALLN